MYWVAVGFGGVRWDAIGCAMKGRPPRQQLAGWAPHTILWVSIETEFLKEGGGRVVRVGEEMQHAQGDGVHL